MSRAQYFAEVRSLLRLAVPIIVSQLGQIGMNTADTIMVGPLGAAVGLGSAIHSFLFTVSIGVIVGMAPLVSQAFGAGDLLQCRRTLVQGLWLSLLLSVPAVLLHLVGREISLMLGQAPEVAALTGDYLRAIAASLPAIFVYMAYRQFLEGMGVAKPAMVFTFLGLGLNIIMNRVLIYGVGDVVPAMGLVGSGWATTIVRWSMVLGLAAYVSARAHLHPFAGISRRLDPLLLGRITRIGAPASLQFGLEVGLFAFAAVMMGWLGPLQLAAHQVTINIAATTFMVALGVSLAGSIHVGQHIGAGRAASMRSAVLATYTLAVGFMAGCALVFVTAGDVLIGLYTRDAAIVALGSQLLLVAALFQVFDGAQVAGVSVLRGAADTRVPMIVAAIGYWGVGMPIGYLLGFRAGMGPVGVWIGLSAGLAAVGVLLAWRAYRTLWRGPLPVPVAAPIGG
jgi:MATE family multidrug resistance protein